MLPPILLFLARGFTDLVLAQGSPAVVPPAGTIPGCDFVTGLFTFRCIPLFIAYLVKLIFGLVGTIALLSIIYSGYQIAIGGVTGGGTDKGKERLIWSLVGLGACIFAFLIVDMVVDALL